MSETDRCCDEYDKYRLWAARKSRRDFLKTGAGVLAAAPLLPHMMLKATLLEQAAPAPNAPILVIVQLAGGNDGLNTVVPYTSDLYYQSRPTIGVPQSKVIALDSTIGLHPNLASLKPLYDAGKVAIVQDVGYPNPDRSHFRSTQIWETADPTGTTPTGWLGRYLDTALAGVNNPLSAVAIGPMVPMTLLSHRSPVVAIESVDTFRFFLNRQNAPVMDAYREMYGTAGDEPGYLGLVRETGAGAEKGVLDLQQVATGYKPAAQYPQNPLGRELQLVAQLIAANLGTRVFHVTLGGFDDHAAEVYTHANLMKVLADSMAAFYADLAAQGKAGQVLTMTFSEFGRRVKENAGRGTDHGTAAPVFVIGGGVKGGIYADDPNLSSLDPNGDLVYKVDFRSVYGTVLDGWLGGGSAAALGSTYEKLPFL